MKNTLYFLAAIFILNMIDQVNPQLAMTLATLSLVILLTNRGKYFSLYYNN